MTDVFDDAIDAVLHTLFGPGGSGFHFAGASNHSRTPLGGGLSVDTSFAGSFDGSYLDLAHGSETIIQLGLAHAAAALLPTLKQRRFLLAEVGQFGFIFEADDDDVTYLVRSIRDGDQPWLSIYGLGARLITVNGRLFVAVVISDYARLLRAGARAAYALFAAEAPLDSYERLSEHAHRHSPSGDC